MQPYVSIIVPARNEEKFIAKCLDSLISQDFPKDRWEILVVDGNSQDKTKDIVKNYINKHPFIRLLENQKKFTSFGLNIGIKEAKGEIIIRIDAHAGYEKTYISKCLKYLKEYDVDNVGGIIKTLPIKNTITAKAIATCLSHPFGAAADFRVGVGQPKFVDTVFGGCYKREIFKKIGLYNENLLRSQDMEFNLRLKKAGGKILLAPDITACYYPQSNLFDFFEHNIEDGIWAILPLKFIKAPFKLRHYLPLAFIITLPLSIWPYILVSLFFSLQVAFREKSLRLFFIMPWVFAARHFGYGIGSLVGLVKLLKK
jgi:glycosyltransferase involved in cell wall biosynthesis